MQFVTEKHFEHLPCEVAAAFVERRYLLKVKLKIYQLDVYFLSDSDRQGPGTIRGYIESFDFDKFTQEQLRTGGKYVSFCELFKVCLTLSCTYVSAVYIFLLKVSKRTFKTRNSPPKTSMYW